MLPLPTRSLQDLEAARVASLAFLIYEICITLDQEIGFIWTKSNKSWLKWQYLFTRYFALAALMANRSVEMLVTMRTESLPPPLRNLFSCQVVIGAALMLSVEVVLMARVYALYKYSVVVACMFGILFVCEIISAIVGVALRRPQADLTPEMVSVSSPDSFIYFGVTAIISQVVILSLTLFKCKSAGKVGSRKPPIVTLVIRDGAIAFLIILSVTAWTLLSAITDQYVPISDSWFLAIVSCAGCRLVINLLQSSSDPEATVWGEFTTVQPATVEAYDDMVSIDFC